MHPDYTTLPCSGWSVQPFSGFEGENSLMSMLFLQRVSIASYAKRCISYDRFCPTVW